MAEINDAPGAKEYLVEMRKKFDKTMAPEMKAAMKEAINALDLEIPAMPDIEGDGYADGHLVYDTWICPNCGTKYEIKYDEYKHCPECGQVIDWAKLYEQMVAVPGGGDWEMQ